uniref:Uncharacterized protein n=1 Tax=Aegilops tauschii subsp. strangulata TaxID=200361 RepID=A0A453E7K2_AEGTS
LGRSMSLVGEKHTLRSQVLFPKDYILRKVFRKDGPSLGGDPDLLPERAHVHVRDTTGHHSYQDQSVLKKRKIMSPTAQRSTLPFENNDPVRKHGKGKGLMTVWHAMYSQTAEIQDCSSFIDESGCLRSLRPFEDFGGKLAQFPPYNLMCRNKLCHERK